MPNGAGLIIEPSLKIIESYFIDGKKERTYIIPWPDSSLIQYERSIGVKTKSDGYYMELSEDGDILREEYRKQGRIQGEYKRFSRGGIVYGGSSSYTYNRHY